MLVEKGKTHTLVIALVAWEGYRKFEWYGGEYIAVKILGTETEVDVINVWDYEAGEPRIDFTPDGLAEAVASWLDEGN